MDSVVALQAAGLQMSKRADRPTFGLLTGRDNIQIDSTTVKTIALSDVEAYIDIQHANYKQNEISK